MRISLLAVFTCVFYLGCLSSEVSGTEKRKVVLYWGQSSSWRPEKPLKYFCQQGRYDVIVLNYVSKFFASPKSINLSQHCGSVLYNKAYPLLFRCDVISADIRYCQSRGIKVMMGLRSEKGPQFLQKKKDGVEFANNVWNLFLGGSHKMRPFRKAVLDGVSLYVHQGSDNFLDQTIQRLNQLYVANQNRKYYTYVTTTCNYPMPNFKSVIEQMPDLIDGIFIRHDYSEDCHPSGIWFDRSFELWKNALASIAGKTGESLDIYLVITMSKDLAASYGTSYADFEKVYKSSFRDYSNFKGVVLDDAGWDDWLTTKPQNKHLSTLLRELFKTSTGVVKTPVITAKPTTTQTTLPPLKKQPLKIGAFWGQNEASKITQRNEKSLREICSSSTYSTVIVSTIFDVSDSNNKGLLPKLNFANHCYTSYGKGYKTYYYCPKISSDIKYCQSKGVKVLLNIGPKFKHIKFLNRRDAQDFASLFWKLFLGGTEKANLEKLPRTFGGVVLDGVNIELRFGNPQYIGDFVKALRIINNGIMITASPSCIQSSYGTELGLFDHLFVDFDNNDACSINNPSAFEEKFAGWYNYALKSGGPRIWLGLPASPRFTKYTRFLERSDAKPKIETIIRKYERFGGIMLNDASWDYQNVVDNKLYSDYLHEMWNTGVTTAPTTRRRNVKYWGAASKNGPGFHIILCCLIILLSFVFL